MKKPNSIFYLLSFTIFISALYPWNIFLSEILSINPLSLNSIVLFILSVSAVFIVFQNSRYLNLILIAAYVFFFIVFTSIYYNSIFKIAAEFHISVYFFPDKSLKGILTYLFIIIFSISIWTASFRIINIDPEKKIMRIRFDSALASFLLLLLIKLIIAVKGGDIFRYERSIESFFLLLVSGFFAFSLNPKIKSGDQLKTFFVILVYSLVILITSISLYYFISPDLKLLAASGFGILEIAGSGFEKGITVFIKFFLDFRFRKKILNNVFQTHEPGVGVPVSGGSVPDDVLFVFLGFITLLILSIGAVFLFLMTRIIIRRIIKNRDKGKRAVISIIPFFNNLKNIFNIIISKSITPFPVRIYFLLKIFGYINGMRNVNTETPKEYGTRLSCRFHLFNNEIIEIVEIYNDFIYGNIIAERKKIKTAKSGMRNIINPVVHIKRKRIEKKNITF